MRNTKRKLEVFSFHDRTGIAARMEAMAAKGWLLEKIGTYFWTYRRISPQKLRFFVTYYPRASAFDPSPSEEQNTYYDFCAHTGWTLAAASGQMQVFYSGQDQPVPIETDPVVEVDNIHRSAKRSMLPSFTLLLLVALLNGGLFLWNLRRDPVDALSSTSSLFSGVCWVILMIICLDTIISYLVWHRRAVPAAERGEFLEPHVHSWLQLGLLWIVGVGFVLWIVSFAHASFFQMTVAVIMLLYIGLLLMLSQGMMHLLKRRGVSAKVNRIVTITGCFVLSFGMMAMIIPALLFASERGFFAENHETYQYRGSVFTVYEDQLPLTVEDLLDVHYDGYTRERRAQESPLLAQFDMRQWPRLDAADFIEMPSLEYTLTEVKLASLYDFCRNSLLRQRDETDDSRVPEGYKDFWTVQDPAPWGALEAYRISNQNSGLGRRYLLCYPTRMVEISFDWEVTPEQMAIVGEKLGW